MSVKFTLLGCGSSMGVPRADGFWGKCNPNEKKNFRTRCSALISTPNKNILIDTSPDLRFQLLKQKINSIDTVLYSHHHADQTHGINDLRIFYIKNKKRIDIYCDKLTSTYFKKNFSYCFNDKDNYPATLKLNFIKKNLELFDNKDKVKIKTIPVKHGSIDCQSFIINESLAYASDISYIYKKDLNNFKNLKYLIIDCLRIKPHPSHYNLEQILKLISFLKPYKSILTNLHSDLDYKYLLKVLPKNIKPAYDGLTLKI